MANNYQLLASNITATSVQITVISDTNPSTTVATIRVACFKAGSHGGATEDLNDPGTAMAQNVGTVTFSHLDPETEYAVSVTTPYSSNTVRFTTLISPDTPRLSTQQQWEYLAGRVKAPGQLLDSMISKGAGAPTTSTVGTVGKLYEDTTNGKLYICTTVSGSTYTWVEVGGSAGPTVVQTTGTSTTDVMSQNAVSDRLYSRLGTYQDAIGIVGANETQDSSAGAMSVGIGSGHKSRGDNSVAIGAQATIYAAGMYSVAVGSTAKTEGHSRAVAIGNAANAAYDNSVAIGSNAVTTAIGEVNIGAGTSGRGYNSTNYRLLSGVHDGQSAHDAATKGQLDGLITMTTTDPGEGSPLAANTYLAVYGGDPVILDYATSEINTGTKWINGDTIYKKTVSVGNLPNATTAITAHNISNFATLVKLEGSFTNGSNSAPIPYASPTTTKCVQAYADATNITIVTGEDRSAYSGYVTLYYTKSS